MTRGQKKKKKKAFKWAAFMSNKTHRYILNIKGRSNCRRKYLKPAKFLMTGVYDKWLILKPNSYIINPVLDREMDRWRERERGREGIGDVLPVLFWLCTGNPDWRMDSGVLNRVDLVVIGLALTKSNHTPNEQGGQRDGSVHTRNCRNYSVDTNHSTGLCMFL